ncbi:3-oxoacyl-ACP synthase III family protein [Streptomyces odontomachi]|uniref:3-oxoacyl-ACP synthase III family protein n=1 Tax=Streptomyces odontomachi TaxID=2944940 RepID=UPI00210B170E|nr:3-oxoacyl-ACP synthase III family protein [Streptomyces sp. ODS25]
MHSPDIHVRSVGTALPGPAIDNATLAKRFRMPSAWEQWIDAFVGTRQRHFSLDLDTGEILHTPADLGEQAGRRALESAGLAPSDVDLMVMGTSSPEKLMPATVNVIADRLGINAIPAYQLQSGCTGAFQALDVAHQMLQTGRHRTALVIGTESCAKHFDVTQDVAALPPGEQINGVLFGDGAGAVVLSTEPGPDPVVLRHVFCTLVGLGREPGQTVEWFGRADKHSDRPPVVEDYKAIEESVPELAADVLAELLEELDWKEDEVDYLLPPQLSGVMTAKITARLDVPNAHEVSCVTETGNTGNALPFFQLERALPRMISGDRAIGISVESSKWIKAGLGLEKI